jgi:hypothetical protein
LATPSSWHGFFTHIIGNNIINDLKFRYMAQNKQDQRDPQGKPKNDPSRKYMPDGTEEPSKEANREADYDQGDQPDTSPKFDDNPDETKRKIPNM